MFPSAPVSAGGKYSSEHREAFAALFQPFWSGSCPKARIQFKRPLIPPRL